LGGHNLNLKTNDMKRVIIAKHQRGLVFENGNLVNVLTEGNHWSGFSKTIETVSVFAKMPQTVATETYLSVDAFAQAVAVLRVKSNEIILHFEAGIFKQVLTKGTHVFWKSFVENTFEVIDLNETTIPVTIDKNWLALPEIVPFVRVYKVESFQQGLQFINGNFVGMLEPGTYHFWKNTTEIELKNVDMRSVQFEVLGQEILTKDKTALRVNFAIQFKVTDPIKAVIENKDFEKQLYVDLQLVLREIIGAATLDELLENKLALTEQVIEGSKAKVANLGVEISEGGIKDIILPGEVKDILNRVLVAEKQAQANMIMRREETASTRNLLNTAKLMEDNAMLFKLKEMEFVEKIAEKISDISITSGDGVANQLKTLFAPSKQ
jgi:SPFH domain / Band 7 family